MNAPVTEFVKRLLVREQSPYATRFHNGLELQVQPFDAKVLSDLGICHAFPIRIPKNARSDPIDNDRPMPYHPGAIQRLGWTGWNWRDRCSEFVVFDLDSLINHKAGLDADKLEAAKEASSALPYVTVRRSKSGLGYHGYVEFANPPHSSNHTEHARLARAVLQKMSADAQFDFATSVDVVGGNAWFHDRQPPRKLT